MLDLFEARPHGRLLRYDPVSRRTTVLLRDLYFANGVALSQRPATDACCGAASRCLLLACGRSSLQFYPHLLDKCPDTVGQPTSKF